MVKYCKECGNIVDQIRELKGKEICAKCQKKIYNKTYYEKNKESIIANNSARVAKEREEQKKLQKKRDKKAEYARNYRRRVKEGTVGDRKKIVYTDEVIAQLFKDMGLR